MNNSANDLWDTIEETINQSANQQRNELLKCGRRLIPNLTTEDILQPNDYNQLENNPHFRFEEGVLAGVQTLQMALLALKNEQL